MSKKSRDIKDFWIFVGPALFAMTMVVIIPFIIGIYYTFTNWNGANPHYDFVGIKNYTGIFKDVQFIYSLKITVLYYNCERNNYKYNRVWTSVYSN